MTIPRHWISVFFLTFTFLCVISSTEAQIREREEADSLMHRGMFGEAAIAFEKVYYYSDRAPDKARARLNRGNCLKQLGRYKEVIKDLGEIRREGLSDSLQLEILYQKALCCYLSEDFLSAGSLLEQYHHLAVNKQLTDALALLEILNYNQLLQYDTALEVSLQWVSTLNFTARQKDSINEVLYRHYSKRNVPRIVSEKKARLLSAFIPGSGQVYDGFAGEGAVNFLLNAAALGTGIYGVLEAYYLSGYLVGVGLLHKLYLGGIRRASFLATKGNYLRTKEFNDQLKVSLTDIFSLAQQGGMH